MPPPSQESSIALKTYHAYVEHWVNCVESIHGRGPTAIESIKKQMQEMPAFLRLGQKYASPEIDLDHRRGMLTLTSIRQLPDHYPQLASLENHWLPVKCYYAIHGVGLAALMALGHSKPTNHGAFCAAFSERIIKQFFPAPINALCSGGPDTHEFVYSGVDVSPIEVTQKNALASNRGQEMMGIAKSLSTTRQRIIKARFSGNRKAMKKVRLIPQEKKFISQKLYSTSICDFFFRMRARSNYNDPDMYIVGLDDSNASLKHYTNLLFLTEVLVAATNAITEKGVGRARMSQMEVRDWTV